MTTKNMSGQEIAGNLNAFINRKQDAGRSDSESRPKGIPLHAKGTWNRKFAGNRRKLTAIGHF